MEHEPPQDVFPSSPPAGAEERRKMEPRHGKVWDSGEGMGWERVAFEGQRGSENGGGGNWSGRRKRFGRRALAFGIQAGGRRWVGRWPALAPGP